jgi:hypothetical protein
VTDEHVYRWRGLDMPSLEVLRWHTTEAGVSVHSTLSVGEVEPYAVSYEWQLDAQWRTVWLRVLVEGEDERSLLIERIGPSAWRVDEEERPDLFGCVEVDLSITPFCNGLALRHLDGDGEFTALYVAFPELAVQPSVQRYEKLGERQYRYIDLGAAAGFEATLEFDAKGFVTRYEGLFELLPDGM